MKRLTITLVDYGAGNLPSVERGLRLLEIETRRAATAADLSSSQAVILPGVGHFGALMRTLRDRGLLDPLRGAVHSGVPFLGICLGLQALYSHSEEDPQQPGLGIFEGRIQLLPQSAKLPHMGWNQLRRLRPSRLLSGVAPESYFYFAHSYAALEAGDRAVALCDHGVPFVAVMEDKNVMAVQFHPEKSGQPGAAVLRNFAESVE